MSAWIWAPIVLVVLAGAWLTIRYSLFVPAFAGLPVLMYHKIHESRRDSLTVTRDQFEQQLRWLSEANYTPITCRQLVEHIEHGTSLPPRPVLITFDDGYVNNLTHAYPLLERYGFKATIFLPLGWLGQVNGWDEGDEPLLDAPRLAGMKPEVIEFGLHSYRHENYEQMTPDQIAADARRCWETAASQGLAVAPALAYPYGKYPRQPPVRAAMEVELAAAGVRCGLRIGNRINRLPIKRPYEIRRINVKGTDTLWEFSVKVRKGRVKLF
jgi:peptidoglycan/xylan/chitin deacetylase (PgdA/CDA1 family)